MVVAAAAKSLKSCPTLSDPMDCSLPGSSIHGIFQARVLEWGAIAFSDPYMTTGKTIALTRWTFVGKVMSLLLNMLSAKSLQSCPTLCDPIDGSSLGSPVPGILQARTLEWVAISFFNA